MRRVRLSLLLAVAVLLLTVTPALAIWPTTCIQANDAFEYSAGRFHNVGIYQRVFPDPAVAEAQCQQDHRDDIRGAFAWAFRGEQLQPTPQPAPAEGVRQHPDWRRLYHAAQGRGADTSLATAIADNVVQRSSVDAFLRGADDGVQFGRWDCHWRSDACPLAPERPPEVVCLDMGRDPNFRRSSECPHVGIDEGLVEAYELVRGLDIPRLMEPFNLHHWDDEVLGSGRSWIDTVWIRWDDSLPDDLFGNFDGHRNIHISTRLRHEPPHQLAALLAHEMSHAAVDRWRIGDSRNDCLWDEVLAFVTEAMVRAALGLPTVDTPYEREIQATMLVLIDTLETPGWVGNDDKDLSEWWRLVDHLLYERGYDGRC